VAPDVQSTYRQKLKTAAAAVALLRSEDTVAVPIATGQPGAFLSALGERQDYRALSVFGAILTAPYPVFTQPNVRFISGFYGPVERMMQSAGANIDYLPADFLGWERYAEAARPRVMASALAPMDEGGYLSFGLHSGATFNAFLAAARDPERVAIGEVVRDMPRVGGLGRFGGHRIHISQIDCVIESDQSAYVLPEQPASTEDEAIAAHVEELVADGSTVQIGIGAIPNRVARLLAQGRKGDFGIHTEMFVDGIMELHRAGKVSNHKGIFDGYSVATFAAGSRALYDWMHDNPEVRMLPVSQVNDPAIIRRNRNMVSINSAIAIDVNGQVMADTIGLRQYSGVGGHELFVMGAGSGVGGKSIICLHSSATVAGQRVSSIVASLPLGTAVTTPRHHVQYVVTEHGVASLTMLTARERAAALIAIAHPDFRAELQAAVAVDGLEPKR
jgi:acyl-CoA hydrolase